MAGSRSSSSQPRSSARRSSCSSSGGSSRIAARCGLREETPHVPSEAAPPPLAEHTSGIALGIEGLMEKLWGGEPFWGLGYEWDPDWYLTEAQQKLRALLIELCESELRANAKALGRRAALSARQLRGSGRARVPVADRARGARRPRPESRRLRDGVRDARPLRVRVDGDVLRDAHVRRGRDHGARRRPS